MAGNSNSDILIAGAIAAFTVDLLVYPLDTIKTRIQAPEYARLYTDAATGKPSPALFRGVYQGIGSVIIATLPASGAFFTTYERTKALLTTLNTRSSSGNASKSPSGYLPTPIIHATASSLAELVSCALLTPAEVIKQNAQMVSSNSPTNATLVTLAKFRSNPLALWRGYTALAGRNLPFTAMQFPVFERLKAAWQRRREEKGVWSGSLVERGCVTAVSAGAAGAVAAVLTTPVDVVKTRIMLAAAETAGDQQSSKGGAKPKADGLVDALGHTKASVKSAADSFSAQKRKGSLDIAREIVKEKGVAGLWRGGALRGVWTFVGSGLYLGAYESGRVYLAGKRGEVVDEEELF